MMLSFAMPLITKQGLSCVHSFLQRHPWVHCLLVLMAYSTHFFHSVLFLASLQISAILFPHHSCMSSSHSLFGLPVLLVPSIIPNVLLFTSLLSFIRRTRSKQSQLSPNNIILSFDFSPNFFVRNFSVLFGTLNAHRVN